MFSKKHLLVLFVCFVSVFKGQTNIRAMFYNTLNYSSDTQSQNRTPYLRTILEEVAPDLFMVCELKNEIASNYLFENALLLANNNFNKAEFKNSESPATGLLQMVYYNSEKLELVYNEVIPTEIRDINHYTFNIKSDQEEESTKIEVFVTHLKASRGASNMQKRLASIDIFTRELDRLPENSHVLFAGDFNFYTSNEPGFQKIIDENNSIPIIDPIDRLCPTFPDDGINYSNEDNYDAMYFWNNSSFSDVHSQSTRNSEVNVDGAGGGMDDRFDFIMMSKNFTTSNKLIYMEGSYKTIGNNTNCYNSYVSNSNCSGTYTQELRNALYYFSDHLPISIDLEFKNNSLSLNTEDQFTILNSNVVHESLTIQIKNPVHQVLVYNQLGQIVLDLKHVNSEILKIDITHFKKGVYYVKIDKFKVQKIIKI